jgi:hypothetical protein
MRAVKEKFSIWLRKRGYEYIDSRRKVVDFHVIQDSEYAEEKHENPNESWVNDIG